MDTHTTADATQAALAALGSLRLGALCYAKYVKPKCETDPAYREHRQARIREWMRTHYDEDARAKKKAYYDANKARIQEKARQRYLTRKAAEKSEGT